MMGDVQITSGWKEEGAGAAEESLAEGEVPWEILLANGTTITVGYVYHGGGFLSVWFKRSIGQPADLVLSPQAVLAYRQVHG